MKNLWRVAQSLGLLYFIGACGMLALNALAIVAASFGLVRPFSYFQYLRVFYWSVALPALGILMLLPLALREAFTYKSAPEEEKVAEPVDWRRVVERWRGRLHLRPV
jgi:hypothetical protein